MYGLPIFYNIFHICLCRNKIYKGDADVMKYDFEEALEDAQGFVLTLPDGNDVPGFFTNLRIDRNTLPDGYYAFDIRGGDDEDFCTLEETVRVNHTGTFITKYDVDLGSEGYLDLEKECDYTFDDSALDEYGDLDFEFE